MSTAPTDKIICSFSLVPEGKQKLQEFFDAHFDELRSRKKPIRQKAMADLVALVHGKPEGKGVFPKESLEELRKIVAGKSEMALLLTNCPEAPNLQNAPDSLHYEDTYAYHLSQALYAIGGLKHSKCLMPLTRASHKEKTRIVPGLGWHRDMIEISRDDNFRGEFLTLTSPYNGEHALTDIMNLKNVLKGMSQQEREELQLKVSSMNYKKDNISAQELYERLLNEAPISPVRGRVRSIEPLRSHGDAFYQHMKGTSIDLQPGDLLFLDEKHIFHGAHPGQEEAITQIPPDANYSRVLLHNAASKEGRAY